MTRDAFFEQVKVCPVCRIKFTVTRVRSSACYVTERETDFHVKYQDINPLLYSIWVCPNCQYSNIDKDFEQDFKPHELERLAKGLPVLRSEEPELGGQRTPETALRALGLAIRTAMVRHAPAVVLAGLYLRTAWIYRELGNTEEEMKYLEQAKISYQTSYEKDWDRYSTKMSDSTIMYLIGELNRRLGNIEEAVKWFSRTAMNKDIKKEPEINRLVRDQWEIAREGYKKQQAGMPASRPAGDSPAQRQSDGQPAGVKPEQMPEAPPSEAEQPSRPKTRGSMVKMYLSLYMDQVEWLKNIAGKAYEKHHVFFEKEAVARTIIDAFMEGLPEPGEFKSEEELKQLILAKFPGK